MNIQHCSRTNMSRPIFDQSYTFCTRTPLDQIFPCCCVRKWWGLVFFLKNRCFLTNWWFSHGEWGTILYVLFFALVYIIYVMKDIMYYSMGKDFYLIKNSSVNCWFLWRNCVKKYKKHESLYCWKLRIQQIKFLYWYHGWTFANHVNI